MFDTRDQILNQLRAGKDGRAEFKEVRFGDRGVLAPNTQELAGELVAFANAEGGVVFLGVDDSGAVRGISPEQVDMVEHWLLNVATHNCDPPIRLVIRKALLPGAEGDDNFLSRIRSKRTGQVFLESRGEGVRKILEDGEAHSGRRPKYELFGDELRLTLWAK